MDNALRREADTMGFYVCVTLFAALTAYRDHAAYELRDLLTAIWLTTVGLALAHWFAATVAARLVPEGVEHHRTTEVLGAHLIVPATVAAITSVVVAVAPRSVEVLAGRITTGAALAVLVWMEARRGPSSPQRALRLAALAFACAAGIAVLKRLIV